jgi:hypothetical protein
MVLGDDVDERFKFDFQDRWILGLLPVFKLSENSRKEGRHAWRVFVERMAESLLKQFFFLAYSNLGAGKEDRGGNARHPLAADRKSRRHEYSKHSEINRMPHAAVRPSRDQFVAFDHAGPVGPLFAETSRSCPGQCSHLMFQ